MLEIQQMQRMQKAHVWIPTDFLRFLEILRKNGVPAGGVKASTFQLLGISSNTRRAPATRGWPLRVLEEIPKSWNIDAWTPPRGQPPFPHDSQERRENGENTNFCLVGGISYFPHLGPRRNIPEKTFSQTFPRKTSENCARAWQDILGPRASE